MAALTTASPQQLARDAAELDRVLRADALRAVFQPIVELDSGRPVGYEALARGPEGSPLELPDRLFATAYQAGRVAELDWACRSAVLRTALDVGLPDACWLSINTEPATLGREPPSDLARLHDAVEAQVPLVLEITERDIAARPAQLLHTINWARTHGCRIALDDIGTDPRVLALLPVIAPEIIKLDLRLVQQRPDADIADIMAAVNAHAERSGAVILAEGIETARHEFVARSLGATLGQGWLYGRPAPLPSVRRDVTAGSAQVRTGVVHRPTPTPFEIARDQRPVRVGVKPLLIELSKHLERQAETAGRGCMVIAAFQHARHFTDLTAHRFARLVEHTAFVAALGHGMPASPLPGVRGGALAADDPLLHEWDIVVLGPRTAGVLVSRDLGDTGDDMERRFEFVLSYDADLATRMASSLLCRIDPEPADPFGTLRG